MKPKGLRLFDRSPSSPEDALKLEESVNDTLRHCLYVVCVSGVYLDADQLDKLASRCKEWSKYLRSQKQAKPVPPKKWEDL